MLKSGKYCFVLHILLPEYADQKEIYEFYNLCMYVSMYNVIVRSFVSL